MKESNLDNYKIILDVIGTVLITQLYILLSQKRYIHEVSLQIGLKNNSYFFGRKYVVFSKGEINSALIFKRVKLNKISSKKILKNIIYEEDVLQHIREKLYFILETVSLNLKFCRIKDKENITVNFKYSMG